MSAANPCAPPSALIRLSRAARDRLAAAVVAEACHAGAKPSEAVYLAAVAWGCPKKSIARTLNVTPRAVRDRIGAVERRRDCPTYDRHLDELELAMIAGGCQ